MQGCQTQFLKRITKGPCQPNLIQSFLRRRFKYDSLCVRMTQIDGKSSHGLWSGKLKISI
jgi:hypothetical protein